MSSGYGERGGYGQQQPGGYPQQGYGAPPAAAAPRPQGHAAGAAQKSGAPSGLVWALLVITLLNLLLTAYMAYQVYSAVSAFSQLSSSLGDLGSLGGSGSLGGTSLSGAAAGLLLAAEARSLDAGAEGLECVRVTLGAGTDLHAPMGATEPVVALDHVEPGQATGARSFQVLHGPHNGSTRATMFVGCIPPGKAPWHYHLYDEIVWILRGEGRLHLGDDVEELAPGAAFRLRPREVHIVENTHADTELAVLGIFTPAGSPSAAYLEPHVAGAYVFAG